MALIRNPPTLFPVILRCRGGLSYKPGGPRLTTCCILMITMIMMNLKNTSFHCSFCFFVFCFFVSLFVKKSHKYALLKYGNMPVQPRFRVKFLLKFKYENVVRLAFQKKFYSKTRMDGHITIREKSVFVRLFDEQRNKKTKNKKTKRTMKAGVYVRRAYYEELCKQLLYRLNKCEHYYPLSPNFFLTSSLIHLFGQ